VLRQPVSGVIAQAALFAQKPVQRAAVNTRRLGYLEWRFIGVAQVPSQ